MFASPNTLLIECIIQPSGSGTQNKNPFGTQMQLQDHKVIAIETFSNQDVTNSPISTGNPVIPVAVFKAAFLTLYTAESKIGSTIIRPEGLWYDQIPLPRLRTVNNYSTTDMFLTSGTKDIFRIRPTEISWTKTYVTIPTAVSISQQYSALFLVHYLDKGDDGKDWMHHG